MESLAHLNAQLPDPVPMARFRPNLVLAGGGAAFAEDAWGRLRVGGREGPEFDVVRPCDRCGLPAVDQETGIRCERSPLDALSRFRTGAQLGWAAARKRWTHASFFATYLVPVQPGGGMVRVGDAVDVVGERSWGAAPAAAS